MRSSKLWVSTQWSDAESRERRLADIVEAKVMN
jgi:hypothetical protein